MKKYLIALFSAAAVFAFISCGSTANIDPNANKKPLVSEEPKTEEPAPVVEELMLPDKRQLMLVPKNISRTYLPQTMVFMTA